MGEDGSVVIGIDLNVSEAEKELARLKKKVLQLEEEVGKAGAHRDALKEQWEQATKALEEYRAANSRTVKGASTPFFEGDPAKLAELTENVSNLKKEIDKYDEAIRNGNIDLEYTKQRWAEIAQVQSQAKEAEAKAIADQIEADAKAAGEAAKQAAEGIEHLEKSSNKSEKSLELLDEELQQKPKDAKAAAEAVGDAADAVDDMAKRTDQASSFLDKFTKRIIGLARRVFVFTLITKALRSMRDWMGKAVKTNSEATAAMARLKGTLLTLAQPLVNVIIPAFTALANVLTAVIGSVAGAVSALFGTTVDQSAQAAKNLYEEQQALDDVGSSAKKAGKSMASFDEINKLSSADSGGVGDAAAEIAPDFSWSDALSDKLKEIADLVTLVGAGFLLWKIGDMLPGALGSIATNLGLILMLIGGILLYWDGLTDAWENGVDWANLIEMVGGLALAVFALYQLLGPVAAGIALVVGGLVMLVTAFHDAMENGWNLQNTLLAIAGIVGTGLGFAFIAGSVIPLLIAGITALLLAFTVATGHGEELLTGIRTILEGFVDFFTGVFSGDIEKAIGGISKIFDGLKTVVGAVISGIRDAILGFLDWLDKKTGGKLHGIIEAIKGFVTDVFDTVSTTFSGIIDAVKDIFGGIVEFVSGVFTGDWEAAWEGVKSIFSGIWNAIISVLEGAVNLVIDGLNLMVSALNKLSFDVPDWVPLIGGETFGFNIPKISKISIPRLAEGAVIPPNREFMAVLGDQKSGPNIEAPAQLIKQMVMEALRESGAFSNSNQGEAVMVVDGEVFGRLSYKLGNRESSRIGVNLVEG